MNNTLKYVKILESTGITREQAEAHVQLITEITEGDLATKHDIKILETSLSNVIEVKTNHLELKVNNLENKIQQLESRLTIKLGTLLIIGFTSMATLMKFLLVR